MEKILYKIDIKYFSNDNLMTFNNIYIFLYIFYSIFGYNCLHRYNIKKKIDICKINYKSYAFIGKRLLMLSHLDFLYTYYYLTYPNFQRYINLIFLQIIVNGGYYIIWNTSEFSTLFMHIFWGIFIILHSSLNLKYENILINFNSENYLFLLFLLLYLKIYKNIYTTRNIIYDEK